MAGEYAIETNGLEKTYQSRFGGREVKAVAGLSLRVPAGVKFGLLGPNGAGKTTFVKMVLAAVNPSAGTAALFGRDVRDAESRRPVGYLPENHRFPTYFTGSGMLDFYGALSGMSLQERRRRIPEMLELVGLKDWGEVRIKKYSKGMLQRLGLAQALMHRPKLLILDEPTDGVDPTGRRHIRTILDALAKRGVSIFINSHLLSEVESFCDYVAILHRGRLALEGKISTLTAGKGYQVKASGVPPEAVTALKQAGIAVWPGEEMVELNVPNKEDANRAIDILRDAGAMVENLAASTSSLEDVFIRVTQSRPAA